MKQTDVIIIGGGLAGLTAAIHLSRHNLKVLLFEKEKFPHHKVCGEYLSNEVLPYFDHLEVDIQTINPIKIGKLHFSTRKSRIVKANLPLGGLGISRYELDDFLYKKALENGVKVIRETITAVNFYNDFFEIKNSENNSYYSRIVLGAYGKRSNLDKYLDRDFINKKSSWLAVKSHYQAENFPKDVVALHNFKGGYCGLSTTENGNINVCYLTTYKSFKKHKEPFRFQEMVLNENKHLKLFFQNAKPVFENPLTIAQISFDKKSPHTNHILMLGDAAGLIHPLCGNGMAMAIHSAKLASEVVLDFFENKKIGMKRLEDAYSEKWNLHFKKRLRYGKWLQSLLLTDSLAEASQSVVAAAPFMLPQIIKQTHGTPIL